MNDISFQWRDNGDSALTLLCPSVPSEQQSRLLWALAQRVQQRAGGAILDIVPAYDSITFTFKPFDSVREDIIAWVPLMLPSVVTDTLTPTTTRIVDIPVCYEASFAPDLPALARQAGMSVEEVIQTHSAGIYFVHMLGFSPGFMYLGGLPPQLHCPRKATPTTRVPAGSVAIGGEQTGIYPQSTPGGWHIIGRTPLMLFNATRQPSTLVNALDAVRFVPITAEQFERLSWYNDR